MDDKGLNFSIFIQRYYKNLSFIKIYIKCLNIIIKLINL